MSIIDGMSVELFFVASNTEGIPELVENDFNGFLFEVRDYRRLSQLLNSLTRSELRMKIGYNSRKKYLDNHSEIKYMDTL
uniref:glycosyltransferase n=1 Tax=Roseivirga sp. TaxID=1964215 RepID=UPI004048D571